MLRLVLGTYLNLHLQQHRHFIGVFAQPRSRDYLGTWTDIRKEKQGKAKHVEWNFLSPQESCVHKGGENWMKHVWTIPSHPYLLFKCREALDRAFIIVITNPQQHFWFVNTIPKFIAKCKARVRKFTNDSSSHDAESPIVLCHNAYAFNDRVCLGEEEKGPF